MIDVGHFCLVVAWLMSLYGFTAGVYGARSVKANPASAKAQAWVRSARNSVLLCCFFSVLSLIALGQAFVTHNYKYIYVWQHSNNSMAAMYRVSAIWGGMDGSMLLWAVIMSIYSAVAVWRSSDVPRELLRWIVPVLSAGTGFFLTVVTLLTNPFRLVPPGSSPVDGNGLNPLLQNPSMMIHPPMLYAGFTGFIVPAAFCFAALISGNLSDRWIKLTRRTTLVAWTFLTCGIILGGNWAYIELGWGGFWAWDPVENASFLPWLTATAFLHSVMVQEHRGMLKIWNVCLSVATYALTVFGTFLTRSGVVQSVHAFAETDIGWVFLAYLGVMIAFTIGLIIHRRVELRPEHRLESYFSREAAFLFNNLALIGICFATFWGTMFPVISEAFAGEKAVVGPPFFNQVNVPLFLSLLFLMGIGPLIAWRKASGRAVVKIFTVPILIGSAVTVAFLVFEPTRPYPALGFGLVTFVLCTIEAEFRRAVRVRRQVAGGSYGAGLVSVVRRKPRRYGGFLVHLGVAIMAVAITASSAYKIEQDVTLTAGGEKVVGRYILKLDQLEQQLFSNYGAMIASITVLDAKTRQELTKMHPEKRSYTVNQETTTEVALRMTPREDLYIALTGIDIAPNAAEDVDLKTVPAMFKVFVNPLQVWVWFGGIVILFGSMIVIGQGLRSTGLEPVGAVGRVEAEG